MSKKRLSNKLAALGESGLIQSLRAQCKDGSADVLIGIGDDAAVVAPERNRTLITSDMMVEGVHFDLSFTTFYQLGYKFLAINISDIFAMGGSPKYFTVSLGIPRTFKVTDIKELYSGILNIAKKFKISLIGGDTCASEKGLVLSGTLLGNAKRIVSRRGAEDGDNIYITSSTGDSAMGLYLLQKQRKKVRKFTPLSDGIKLMKKHLLPVPVPMKSTVKPTSMIDISDGLLIDLSHICDESNVGALIYKDKIPLSKELKAIAKKSGIDPLNMALKGGEDYALLYTAPANLKTGDFRIGEIIKKERYIIDSKGRKTTFKPEGYEHFKIRRAKGAGRQVVG